MGEPVLTQPGPPRDLGQLLGRFALVAAAVLTLVPALAIATQGCPVPFRFDVAPGRVWFAPIAVIALGWAFAWQWIGRGLGAAVSIALAVTWCSCRALTMGDSHWLRRVMPTKELVLAEPGSSFVYHVVHHAWQPAVEFLAPVAGVLATIAWLRVNGPSARRPSGPERLGCAAILWVSSGSMAAFFRGYVEHTQLGVPFLILALGALSRSRLAGGEWSACLFRFAFLIGCAGFVHLHFLGFAPAALFVALAMQGAWSRRVLVGVAGCLLPFAMVGLGLLALQLAGFHFSTGDVRGGANDMLLMPLVGPNGWFDANTMLAPDRLALTAVLLWFACPAWLLVVLLLAWRIRHRDSAAAYPALLAACAYLVFVSACEFDLGWPQDLDLMVAGGPTLLWCIMECLYGTERRPVRSTHALALATCGAVLSWLAIAPMVRPVEHAPGQRNGDEASLVVDGIAVEQGPIRVPRPKPGQRVRVAMRGRPGAACVILRGPQVPGNVEHPYGGSIDIGLAEQFDKTPVVASGVLGSDGRFETHVVWSDAEQGDKAAWQGLVLGPPMTMTAAFYFDPDS